MKGVLFSADFAIDNNGDPRLLELNTDTVVYSAFASSLQLNNLTDVLNANSGITEFHLVYKPALHSKLEALISSSVAENCTNITTYSTTAVDEAVTFPTIPADADSKFILRLAYDENAVFDSTYTKSNLNMLKLMYDNNATSSIGEFYHSSSLLEVNTLTGAKGSSNFLPDFILKSASQPSAEMEFYSIASSETDSTSIINQAKEITDSTNYIEKYYYSPDQISSGKVKALRTYNIMYGTDLNLIGIGSGSYDAIFDFQTTTNFREAFGSGINKLERKHFYEFTNKFPQNKYSDGLYQDEVIEKADGSYVSASLIVSGTEVKSFYHPGLPNTDDMDIIDNWSMEGYVTPSGSLLRSAFVYATGSSEVSDGGLQQLEINNSADLLNLGINTRVLTYNTSSNSTSFVKAGDIDPEIHYLVNPQTDSILPITNNYFSVTNTPSSFYSIDIEPDDVFFSKVGDLGIKVSATIHNAKQF